MSKSKRRRPNEGCEMDMTPMIDVTFQLIIFFVVTASFDREQIDAEVALPTVNSAAVKSLPQQRLIHQPAQP